MDRCTILLTPREAIDFEQMLRNVLIFGGTTMGFAIVVGWTIMVSHSELKSEVVCMLQTDLFSFVNLCWLSVRHYLCVLISQIFLVVGFFQF